MIRVAPAPEPARFDLDVRQKGLSALSEMVGEGATVKRPGPKRKARYTSREAIPSDEMPPYWTEVLDDLLRLYGRLCSYTALYIHEETGDPSVDHFVPKSRSWDRAYEWSNYRLACGLVNGRKGAFERILDPFEIGDWFELELVGYQVRPRVALDERTAKRVQDTIDDLSLNGSGCRQARERYATLYSAHDLSFALLTSWAPFVALELRRQDRLHASDR